MIKLHSVYEYHEPERILYELLLERDPNVNISHMVVPSFDQHASFVQHRPYREWLLIVEDASLEVVGAIILTENNEIGIGIFKAHQRKGIAHMAIWELMSRYQPLHAITGRRAGHFIANINPDNEASIKLFTGLGARHIQNTYQFD